MSWDKANGVVQNAWRIWRQYPTDSSKEMRTGPWTNSIHFEEECLFVGLWDAAEAPYISKVAGVWVFGMRHSP